MKRGRPKLTMTQLAAEIADLRLSLDAMSALFGLKWEKGGPVRIMPVALPDYLPRAQNSHGPS